MEQDARQAIIDGEHLRILSIVYYVQAGTLALISCIPIIHMLMGILFILGGHSMAGKNGNGPPAFLGWFMLIFAGVFVCGGWLIAVLQFLTARALGRRERRTLCLVVAGITCLSIPYGTILGIMSFIVLLRASVIPLFSRPDEGAAMPIAPE